MKKSILSITMTAAIPLAALSLAACGGSQTASTADYIGIDAAKEAALSDAGVSADGAEFSTAGLDSRNGVFYYAVDFTENGVNYEYDIDALTGVVIERAKTPATGGQGEAGQRRERQIRGCGRRVTIRVAGARRHHMNAFRNMLRRLVSSRPL